MAEPYIGDWENPKLVTLGLNPGAAELGFQGRGGHFAEQVRSTSYREWAGTDPYGSDLWEAENTVNPPASPAGASTRIASSACVSPDAGWVTPACWAASC